MKSTRYGTRSAVGTEIYAAAIGARLRGGEVLELASDLGGGKTTFVRGLARGAGSTDHVASPTFTISRQYRTGALTLYHYDFYRLDDPGIMASELHDAMSDPVAVIIVEWSDIVQHVLPSDRVSIRIDATGDQARQLTVEYPDEQTYLFEGVAA